MHIRQRGKFTPAGLNALRASSTLATLHFANSNGVSRAEFEALSAVTSLEALELDGGAKPIGKAIGALAGLKRLKRLVIRGAGLNDSGAAALGALKSVQELDASGSKLTPKGVRALAMCKKLKVLTLSCPALDDENIAYLAGRMTSLEKVTLTGTGVLSDKSVRALSRLPLRSLSFGRGCYVTSGLGSLEQTRTWEDGREVGLRTLRLCWLGDSADARLERIATIKSLRLLEVDVEHATNRGIRHIATLGRLESLVLVRSGRGVDLSLLKALTDLRRVGLLGRKSGKGARVSGLKALPSLDVLHLGPIHPADERDLHGLKIRQLIADVPDGEAPTKKQRRALARALPGCKIVLR